ncbi:hypothetical protein IJ182_07190 [bacterium]|nr:hypothetical protein [bacterium]
MNVSFGMTPNPYYHTDVLAGKKEPQYVDAQSVTKVLDDLKININQEINNAKEDIAKRASYNSLNKLPDGLLKSLMSLAERPIPTEKLEPTPTPTVEPEPTPTAEPIENIF